jgi:uncharacterized membrane protein
VFLRLINSSGNARFLKIVALQQVGWNVSCQFGFAAQEPLGSAGGKNGMLEMRTISGLYDTYDQARLAVEELEDSGIPSRDISIVAPGGHDQDGTQDVDGTVAGAGLGAAVGGVGGLLSEMASFAIPGIGPVVGAGWLVTTLIGAATGGAVGGLLGFLTDAGVEEKDAHVYAEGIRRGSALVLARVDETQVAAGREILGRSSDTAALRREFEADGWAGFDDSADPWDEDTRDEYRRRQDEDPIIPPMP